MKTSKSTASLIQFYLFLQLSASQLIKFSFSCEMDKGGIRFLFYLVVRMEIDVGNFKSIMKNRQASLQNHSLFNPSLETRSDIVKLPISSQNYT